MRGRSWRGRRDERPAGETLDRARDEVRDALAASQTSFTAQLLQLEERTQGQLAVFSQELAALTRVDAGEEPGARGHEPGGGGL